MLLLFSLCVPCVGRQILAAQDVKKIRFSLETSHKLLVGVGFESHCASKPPLVVVPNQAQHFVPLEHHVFSEVSDRISSDIMKIKSGCVSRVFFPNEAFQWLLEFSVPHQGPADLPGWFSLLTCPCILPFTAVLSGAGHLRSH